MATQVIKLKIDGDIAVTVQNECTVRGAAGYRLAGCFTVGAELVLIFQK